MAHNVDHTGQANPLTIAIDVGGSHGVADLADLGIDDMLGKFRAPGEGALNQRRSNESKNSERNGTSH